MNEDQQAQPTGPRTAEQAKQFDDLMAQGVEKLEEAQALFERALAVNNNEQLQ